ncbi:MAG: hypothetical protein ACR2IS_15925, partial [Nitrososphaeraceae archaeon]
HIPRVTNFCSDLKTVLLSLFVSLSRSSKVIYASLFAIKNNNRSTSKGDKSKMFVNRSFIVEFIRVIVMKGADDIRLLRLL